ncbi:hypothetical protein BDQ17DRAFT_1360612 [Cyathus striatus]|nr:hypothetical protein BDQ17DRAFT_1360612 [Cyathus striatus]
MSAPQSSSNVGHPSSGYSDTPRTPKRTPMACQFCRGRKLKCDGMRPSCSNCNKRGYPCVYAPVSSSTPRS